MKSLLKSSLICFVAGCVYALSYPTFYGGNGLFVALLLSLPLFLWKLEGARSLKESLLFIFLYNLGLNITGFYWIPHTLQEFGQLPLPVCYVLAALFSLILQPHWWIYALWKKFRPSWSWDSEAGLLLTAFIMTLLERYVPQQFPIFAGSPWLHLAPHLNFASITGVALYSFMTFWISLELIHRLKTKDARYHVWICLVIFMVLNTLPMTFKFESQDSLNVRIVQANVGNFMKVSSERGDQGSIQAINESYKNLSLTKSDFQPDLIVWPETAFPDSFFGDRTILDPIFKTIMQETGSEMLIGGYDQDPTKPMFEIYETVFNSSILLSENKVKTSYHKNILIPFGETLPFGPLNRKIVEIVPAVSLFAKGQGTPLMETKEGHRFITPICYEVLETDYMRSLLNQFGGNRLIINHTNDSWYGKTAEPYQHLFLSKWRSLEFNLPIVRSTNTGVTSVIFADGSESRQLGIGESGVLDVKVPLGSGEATFYQRFGIFPFIGIFIVLFGMTFLRLRRNKSSLEKIVES